MAVRFSLPTETQRVALAAEMIQAAFVEIRALGLEGKSKQASDLADLFYNVAREMYGWGRWDPALFRQLLSEYQSRYHLDDYDGKRNYVVMLDRALGNC